MAEERTTRADVAIKPMLMAMTMLFRLEPRDATMTSASARVGMLCKMSMRRWLNRSYLPPV